ncbi:hypothetical protein [Actinacidiphila bryophytorum]|nr:hypothetical protein [Actinacidiphila bryophytorum]MBN6547498.1 hypothetical protein [Actinacidiphila bryophytorum]
MADVDRLLNDLAAPRQLLGGELVSAVAWGRTVLASLHAQESLAGVLLADDTPARAGTAERWCKSSGSAFESSSKTAPVAAFAG